MRMEMNSPDVKEETLVEFADIEVVPMGALIDGTEVRLGGEEILELEEVDAPQFYATILMKEEESEESYEESGSVFTKNNENLITEGSGVTNGDGGAPIKRIFNCPLCGKEYGRKDHLNYHMKIHAGFKGYKCDICKKEFRQRVHLRNHTKVHTGQRDYKCQLCGKDFVLKHHLTTHNIKIHTCNVQVLNGSSKRYFKCPICNKEFIRKDHFVYHTKIHTGLRDFKCNTCAREFRQKTHLKNHMKLHTGEREFKCDICGKEFALKHHLTTHNIRIHASGTLDRAELSCPVCNKEFITKRHFNRHVKLHSGLIQIK